MYYKSKEKGEDKSFKIVDDYDHDDDMHLIMQTLMHISIIWHN